MVFTSALYGIILLYPCINYHVMESSALRGTITRLLVKVMHGIFALNFTLYIAKDFVPTGGYTFADKIVCYK